MMAKNANSYGHHWCTGLADLEAKLKAEIEAQRTANALLVEKLFSAEKELQRTRTALVDACAERDMAETTFTQYLSEADDRTYKRMRRALDRLSRPARYPLVYMAHPVGGDVARNLAKATNLLLELQEDHEHEYTIVAPWIHEAMHFDDEDPEQRARGLEKCEEVISRCDELWLCGSHVSAGMAQERACAEREGVEVVDMTGADPRDVGERIDRHR